MKFIPRYLELFKHSKRSKLINRQITPAGRQKTRARIASDYQQTASDMLVEPSEMSKNPVDECTSQPIERKRFLL